MIGEGIALNVKVEPRLHWWQTKLITATGVCPCGHDVKVISLLKAMAGAVEVQPYPCRCGLFHRLDFLQPIAETILEDTRRTASLN